MDGIPGDLYGRLQTALMSCGPFDSDHTLRPLFVDARLSAWRDVLPEASNRAERVRAIIDALSRRANPAGENALVLLLRVIGENTPPGDACREQIAALVQEVAKAAAPVGQLNVHPHFSATPANLRRSFDALMKDKLQGFIGRQFVFDAIDEFLGTHESGYFILRGAPGIGKSAFMAKLVNDRGYIHHFNLASQNIRSTRVFLENVIAQLIVRYELPYQDIPPRALDDGGFLLQCLSGAAAKCKQAGERIVIAVDALDEADRLELASSVNTLYLPSSLPKGVYIVLSTRQLDDLHLQVMHRQTLDLAADSKGNLQDITTYIEAYAQREGMRARLATWGVDQERFVAGLRTKSQGNFMYLYYVLLAIERGEFVHGTLAELPEGLMAYYQRHWRQMREGDAHTFDSVYEPIVCILGVAQEPITAQQISNWTKLSLRQVKASIRLWREFLEEDQVGEDQRYRIYHASFQDFLKEQVDLMRYDDMIADYYLALAGVD